MSEDLRDLMFFGVYQNNPHASIILARDPYNPPRSFYFLGSLGPPHSEKLPFTVGGGLRGKSCSVLASVLAFWVRSVGPSRLGRGVFRSPVLSVLKF